MVCSFISLDDFGSKSPGIQLRLLDILRQSLLAHRIELPSECVPLLESILLVQAYNTEVTNRVIQLLVYTPLGVQLKPDTLSLLAEQYFLAKETNIDENNNDTNYDQAAIRCIHVLSSQIQRMTAADQFALLSKQVFSMLEMAASSDLRPVCVSAWQALSVLATHGLYTSPAFVNEYTHTLFSSKRMASLGEELSGLVREKLAEIDDVQLKYAVLNFVSTTSVIYQRVLRDEPVEKWIVESTLLDMLAVAIEQNDADTVEMIAERVKELQHFYGK